MQVKVRILDDGGNLINGPDDDDVCCCFWCRMGNVEVGEGCIEPNRHPFTEDGQIDGNARAKQ
jgi:hypothetical protein